MKYSQARGRSKISPIFTPTHFLFEALRKPFLSPIASIHCWIRSLCHRFPWLAGTLCITHSTIIMTWRFVSTFDTNLHTRWGKEPCEFGGYCNAPPTFYFEKSHTQTSWKIVSWLLRCPQLRVNNFKYLEPHKLSSGLYLQESYS